MSAPLGWYLSKERRKLIDANFGFGKFAASGKFDATISCAECKFTLDQISTLGNDPLNSSPSQQLTAISGYNTRSMYLLSDFLQTSERDLELIQAKIEGLKKEFGELSDKSKVKRHPVDYGTGKKDYANLRPFSEVLKSKKALGRHHQAPNE